MPSNYFTLSKLEPNWAGVPRTKLSVDFTFSDIALGILCTLSHSVFVPLSHFNLQRNIRIKFKFRSDGHWILLLSNYSGTGEAMMRVRFQVGAKKRCMEWVVSWAGRGQNHPQPDICETEDFPRSTTNFPTRREKILSFENRPNRLQRRGWGAKQTNDHQTNQSLPHPIHNFWGGSRS